MKGSLLSKLIVVLMVPVIARLYEPSDIGTAALFTTCLLILSPLVNLRYCLAIPLPNKEKLADNVLYLCLFLTVSISAVVFVVLIFINEKVFEFFGLLEVYKYRFIIIASSCIVSFYEIFNMWTVRNKRFKSFSNVLIKQSFFGSIVKVLSGFLGFGAPGLIIGTIIQNSFGLYHFSKDFCSRKCGEYNANVKLMVFAFRYYLNYFYFKLPAHLLYVISAQLPIIYANRYFSLSDVGQLSLAISLVAIPVAAVSSSVNKVYFAEMSSIGKNNPDKIYKETLKLLKKLVIVGLGMFALVFSFAPFAFNILLGDSWEISGQYARALSFGLILQISATSIIMVLNVINLNFLSFIIHLFRLLTISFLFYIAYENDSGLLSSIYYYSYGLLFFYAVVTLGIIIILKSRCKGK